MLQLRCCGADGPEDWARSVFNGFRDLDHAPEIGIPRTQADVIGGMALTAGLPKVRTHTANSRVQAQQNSFPRLRDPPILWGKF